MNLRAIDLNLLVILDALLDEAHVSRAAQRLGLTQPAVSAALQRCRALFDDPLLERGRAVMRRTPRGEGLRAPLKTLLGEVEALIDPPEVPLDQIRQSIRIMIADQIAALLLPQLLDRLQATAPGIDLVVRSWRGAEQAYTDLLSGDIHLAMSLFDRDAEGLDRQHILDEHYVVVMRRGHPAAAAFDLDAWLAFPHVVVSGSGATRTPLDARLGALGYRRRVGIVVPSFMMVPDILLATDFIAMMPAHAILEGLHDRIVVHAPPLPVDGFPLHLAWASRSRGDRGLMHVTDELADLVAARIAPRPTTAR
ncbi:LysR family transcriptional regulator [Sphingopyxis fribergensis]|uniref:LysR family transcriptional regulator n=1 Tax=Sphingopyxis fribergensis TaxID=1515612 RepID=A0A0A7PJK6_9SPHN|nr:LysR substrate-binding domain-containing protein [Sphingopyxis fribergensis]AJA10154.1 LysR family transcriptional regulator [Sphingopyxis fribergensis]